jgi:hypothetical protein
MKQSRDIRNTVICIRSTVPVRIGIFQYPDCVITLGFNLFVKTSPTSFSILIPVPGTPNYYSAFIILINWWHDNSSGGRGPLTTLLVSYLYRIFYTGPSISFLWSKDYVPVHRSGLEIESNESRNTNYGLNYKCKCQVLFYIRKPTLLVLIMNAAQLYR